MNTRGTNEWNTQKTSVTSSKTKMTRFLFPSLQGRFAPLLRTNVHQIKASGVYTNHPQSNSVLDGALRHSYYVSQQTEQHWITQHQTLHNHSRKVDRNFCQAASMFSPNFSTDSFGPKSLKKSFNHSLEQCPHVWSCWNSLTARFACRQTMACLLPFSELSKLTMRVCLPQPKRLQ